MTNCNILLADDDDDDCRFFKDALDELPLDVSLNTIGNGAELMHLLIKNLPDLPNMLFLDLNMPRKSGFECLSEIKQDEKLKQLQVIVYSTSLDPQVIDLLYTKGANYYIRKPADFTDLKNVIYKAISLGIQKNSSQPPKEKFVIKP